MRPSARYNPALLLLPLLAALPLAAQDGGHPVDGQLVLTGSLQATDSERLVTPTTSTWQISLQWLIEEGTVVEPGDPIARFDPGSTQSELHNKEDELEEKRQEREAQQAQGKLRRMELELALKRAEIEYKKARIDASIPQDVLRGKDYRERQLALRRTRQAFDDAQLDLLDHDASTRSQLSELDIELREITTEIAELRDELESLTLRAARSGIVLHEVHRWFGRKVRIGDRLQATMPVASIPEITALEIEAWAGETDAARLRGGLPVRVYLDADPERPFTARVESIGTAGERRESWGRASYRLVTIGLDDVDPALMKPGMSVRCEVALDEAAASDAGAAE